MKYKWRFFYIIVLVCSIYLFSLNYENVIMYAHRLTGEQVPLVLIMKYFSNYAFTVGRILFIIIIFILSTVAFFKRNEINRLISLSQLEVKVILKSIRDTIIHDFKIVKNIKYVFLVIPFSIIVFQSYHAWSRPLQYDEAWSYNYHIGNSFISSFALPNNHILYTIVAFFFDKLPIKNELAIRLPLIMAGFGSFLLLYYILRQKFGVFVSWVSSIFFYSSCAVTFYTLYARGYIFVIFFCLLFLLSSYNWIKSNLTNKGSFVWILISFVLGIYSVPTSLYFFVPSFLTIFYYSYKLNPAKLKSLVIGITISSIISIILFLPIFFSSHINNLIDAGNVSNKITFAFLNSYLYYNEEFHFGTRGFSGALYLFVVIVFVYSIYMKKKGGNLFLLNSSLVGLLIPFFFLAIQRIMLAERIMIHLIIYFTIFIALVLQWFFSIDKLKNFKNKGMLVLGVSTIILVFNLSIAKNHNWYTWSITEDKSIRNAALIMQQNNIDTLYLFSKYAKPSIQYYYKINSKKITIKMNDSASVDYMPFNSDFESILVSTYDTKMFDSSFIQIFNDDVYAIWKRSY